MRRIITAAAFAATLVASPAYADKRDFRLLNRTGNTVREVYVSPTRANDWEEDILDVDTLADEQHVDISFDDDGRKTCIYDMKLVYDDGESEEWDKLNLCEVSKITVRYTRDGTAVADFD